MKRSLVVASFLMLSVSASFADSNEWFVGGEFGGMSIHGKSSGSMDIHLPGGDIIEAGSTSSTLNTTYEAIKVGKYFEYGRIYGSFSYQNEKDDISSYSYGLGYDYLFRNKSDFTPFIGLNASYSKAKIDDDDAKVLSLDKPKGFNYGAEVGFLYAMSKNVELEIGARYMISNVDESFTYDDGISKINVKMENDRIIQYYLGLNYKF
jgi:hypothetical protein